MSNLSITPMRAFYDSRMTQEDILLLSIVCNHTDEDGYCWPSLARMSKIYSPIVGREKPYDISSISKKISRLESFGYMITVKQRKTASGTFQSNGYKVLMDAQLPLEFDRRKIQAPLENTQEDIQSPLESASAENQTNDPSERPILNDYISADADLLEEEPEEEFDDWFNISTEPRRTAEDAKASLAKTLADPNLGLRPELADANISRKKYKDQVGQMIAQALSQNRGSLEVTPFDTTVAGKFYTLQYPITKIRIFCEWLENNPLQPKEKDGEVLKPNAQWVLNGFGDWKAHNYPELPKKQSVERKEDGGFQF